MDNLSYVLVQRWCNVADYVYQLSHSKVNWDPFHGELGAEELYCIAGLFDGVKIWRQ